MKITILSIFLIVFFFSLPGISAQEETQVQIEKIIAQQGPINFDVSILLINVGTIDKNQGSYELDFWYTIISEDIDFTKIPPPEIDFTNGIIEERSSQFTEEHYYEERIRGKFFGEMDFRNFPFETIVLDVELEPVRPWTISHGVFNVDPDSGIDYTANVPGWILEKSNFEVVNHSYEDEEETYSRFMANFTVERSSVSSFLKSLLPVLLITGLSISIFWVPENFTPRIYLTAPLLLALIYFHQNALNTIPPLGYMTLFDKIMIIVYSLLGNSILAIVVQMRLQTKYNDKKKTEKANSIMRYFLPIIMAIGVMGILLT